MNSEQWTVNPDAKVAPSQALRDQQHRAPYKEDAKQRVFEVACLRYNLPSTMLCIGYAKSSTDGDYAATTRRGFRMSLRQTSKRCAALRKRYAMSGTKLRYAATRCLIPSKRTCVTELGYLPTRPIRGARY